MTSSPQVNTNPANADQYAVFGHPISQSRSPIIHTWFAEQTAQNMQYQAIEPKVDQFKQSAERFFKEGGRGCNITAPFKLEAYQLADELTERAQWAGSVNTLKKLDDGRLLGDNTDGEGLVQDLLRQNIQLKEASVLIVGAGGATQGVILPLLTAGVAQLTITNRTVEKAQSLVERFQTKTNAKLSAQSLDQVTQAFDLVINATSAGFNGEIPKISANIFSQHSACYDMSYHQQITPFNHWASQHSLSKVSDGLGMLVGQAAESFYLWRGVRPDVESVLKDLRESIGA